MKIKAIIFDCFGVLTTDNWRAFVDALPKGVDVNEARSLNQSFGAGYISREEFFAGVEAITGRTPPLTEDGSEIVKNIPLLGYIGDLRSRGQKIGLLSNIGSSWITETFLSSDEQKLFDEMVLSFEVGMVKPDPNIYELMCRRLDIKPEEAVMVDDVDRYCTAAESVGMHTVVYGDFVQAKQELEEILSISM